MAGLCAGRGGYRTDAQNLGQFYVKNNNGTPVPLGAFIDIERTPIAVFGAFLALFGRGLENNVYAQIGLVMLIGLSAKNAILIVEFARAERGRGKSLSDAALEGARLRLRPILMTSFAFILGCVPLWIAVGAGAVSRQIIGTAVIGGMLAASFIAIFMVPVLFYLVERFSAKKEMPPAGERGAREEVSKEAGASTK